MARCFLFAIGLTLCLLATTIRAQECVKAVGIGCISSYVSTQSVVEAEVTRVFRQFAKSESMECNPVLQVGGPIYLGCFRRDGLYVAIWRDGSRIQIMSQAPYGLKGTETLKAFNRRLAEFLRSHFGDAVDTDDEPRV